MNLQNEFTVKAPMDETWSTLLDIQRVAGCLPGATLQSANGDGVYRGEMRLKLGPVTVAYEGTARMLEVDEDTRTTVIEARAKEAKGQGTASATISNRLEDADGATRVIVETDLNVTGRPAQFGRGVMQDVAARMLDDFARRLEGEILAGPAAPEAGRGSAPSAAAGAAPQPRGEAAAVPGEAAALDLGGVLSGPLLKRAAVPAGACVAAVAVALLLRRGRRRGFSVTLTYR